MGINNIEKVEKLFSKFSVKQIFVKYLAPNQDNEKNQIYFGTKAQSGVLNIFPCEIKTGLKSQSHKKRKSSFGNSKIEARLDFYWLDNYASTYSAPHAKFIYYFQYPEVRFSGFLKQCYNPPDSLRRKHQNLYGKRISILRVNLSCFILFPIYLSMN